MRESDCHRRACKTRARDRARPSRSELCPVARPRPPRPVEGIQESESPCLPLSPYRFRVLQGYSLMITQVWADHLPGKPAKEDFSRPAGARSSSGELVPAGAGEWRSISRDESPALVAEAPGARSVPFPAETPGEWLRTRSEERRVGKECRSRWSP